LLSGGGCRDADANPLFIFIFYLIQSAEAFQGARCGQSMAKKI
jgi:hypothetical protein